MGTSPSCSSSLRVWEYISILNLYFSTNEFIQREWERNKVKKFISDPPNFINKNWIFNNNKLSSILLRVVNASSNNIYQWMTFKIIKSDISKRKHSCPNNLAPTEKMYSSFTRRQIVEANGILLSLNYRVGRQLFAIYFPTKEEQSWSKFKSPPFSPINNA